MQRSARIALAAFIVITAVAIGSAGAATHRARISVDPLSGSPGQLVTIRGSGFCASTKCSRVSIHMYSKVVARVRVSSRGTFVRRHVQVPGGTISGQIGVVATQRLANGRHRQAVALFEVVINGR